MTHELVIVLLLLAAAVVAFALGRPRMDAVALAVLIALPFTGVITVSEALTGFSDANVVLIAALFVIGDGLVRTGVARYLGDWMTARAGKSDSRLTALLMIVVCGAGAVMSSTAVTAIFIPITLRIVHRTGISPKRLLMPVSLAALISGMMTLVATAPNLVINGELVREGHKGFGFFTFTPFGVPVLALAIVYMVGAGRLLLGDKGDPDERGSGRPSMRDWVREYRLADREYRVRITDRSPLAGKTVGELDTSQVSGASIIAIERRRRFSIDAIEPTSRVELLAGDILLVDMFSKVADITELRERLGLEEMPLSGVYFADRSQEVGMIEAIIRPDSELVGQTVIKTRFRTRSGLTVIGLRRGAVAVDRNLLSTPMKPGDTLLLIGPWRAIDRLRSGNKDLVILNLPAELEDVLPVRGKAWHAVGILLLVVALMAGGVIPNVQAALIGCLLMGAFGCVTLPSAYRSIDWKTIVLIVGMLPFSLALQRTGGVELGTHALMAAIGGAGVYVVLGSIFVITAVLGLFISNTATAVLMAPVAIAIAGELKASPLPFAMTVALAASTAFMTPVSSPVNTLVITPGRYTFGDFLRVGVPLAVMVLVICVLMVPWLLPLHPH